jgi:PAS domain S-box-containing protein
VEEITGYTLDDFLRGGLNRVTLIHPDDRAQLSQEIEALYNSPNFLFDHEFRIFTRDGQQRWLHEISQNICDPDGRP